MAYTDSIVNNLVINKMTQAQYDALSPKSDTELYLVPDNYDTVPTNNSSNPITSGGVFTALGAKEDKFTIIDTHKTSDFEASVGNYYFVDIAASDSMSIQLATPTENTKLSSCVFFLTTNTSPALNFAAETDVPVYYAANYKIEANKVYEINALYNGSSWCIAQVEMEVTT